MTIVAEFGSEQRKRRTRACLPPHAKESLGRRGEGDRGTPSGSDHKS